MISDLADIVCAEILFLFVRIYKVGKRYFRRNLWRHRIQRTLRGKSRASHDRSAVNDIAALADKGSRERFTRKQEAWR